MFTLKDVDISRVIRLFNSLVYTNAEKNQFNEFFKKLLRSS